MDRKRSVWIKSASPKDPVRRVAMASLKQRLGAVQHYFALAVERPYDDNDYVHQLRVWTRRAAAALRMYRQLLPQRQVDRIQKQLKRIRRAANDARDCDVFAQRLARDDTNPEARTLLKKVHAQRREAQRPIVRAYQQMGSSGRLEGRADELFQCLRSKNAKKAASGKVCFGPWAEESLHIALEQFFEASRADLSDIDALHQFRIRGKKLRYAMELLGGAFPAPFRKQLYPAVKKLQERLGTINDHATASVRILPWIDETGDPNESKYLHGMLQSDQEQLVEAHRQFLSWWTAKRKRDLRKKFDKLLAAPRLGRN